MIHFTYKFIYWMKLYYKFICKMYHILIQPWLRSRPDWIWTRNRTSDLLKNFMIRLSYIVFFMTVYRTSVRKMTRVCRIRFSARVSEANECWNLRRHHSSQFSAYEWRWIVMNIIFCFRFGFIDISKFFWLCLENNGWKKSFRQPTAISTTLFPSKTYLIASISTQKT